MEAVQPDLFRRFAAAKTDGQLEQFLKENLSGPRGALREWRGQQEEISQAVAFMDEVVSWMRRPPGKKERPHGQRAWITRATRDSFFDAKDPADPKDRAFMFYELAKTISNGLRHTVAMRLSDDLKTLLPEPRGNGLAGVCWYQLAEAARGLASEREEQVCEECNSRFVPRRRGHRNAPVRFCSTKCRNAFTYGKLKGER
jgi:hypothetical protein